MSKNKSNFQPIRMPAPPAQNRDTMTTATTILHGDAARKFEQMVEDSNLSKSALLRQMVLHCVGMDEELKALKHTMLMWGPSD